jgi:hypothetical protein
MVINFALELRIALQEVTQKPLLLEVWKLKFAIYAEAIAKFVQIPLIAKNALTAISWI